MDRYAEHRRDSASSCIIDALYIYQDEARPCADSEYRIGDTSRPRDEHVRRPSPT